MCAQAGWRRAYCDRGDFADADQVDDRYSAVARIADKRVKAQARAQERRATLANDFDRGGCDDQDSGDQQAIVEAPRHGKPRILPQWGRGQWGKKQGYGGAVGDDFDRRFVMLSEAGNAFCLQCVEFWWRGLQQAAEKLAYSVTPSRVS